MGTSLLLDTNIWLDFFLPRRPQHHIAHQLIMESCDRGFRLLYAITSAKDVEYIASAAYKADLRADGLEVDKAGALVARQFAWSCVQSMGEIATAVGADESDIWLAKKLHAIHPDFEDDMILAAAKRCDASFLVTRDQRLVARATVAAITPTDLLTIIDTL